MSNKITSLCAVALIFIALTIQTSSQNTTTITETEYYFDTSMFYSTNIPSEISTNGMWVYPMFISGVLGMVLTSIMGIHAMRALFRESLGGKCQRIFYALLFIGNWSICVAYTFFKSDIIISSIGTLAGCRVGYYMGTTSVYAAKLLLFTVFILRIDTAFHASALGYNRIFLGILVFSYFLIEAVLYLWYIYESWYIIEYVVDDDLFISVGICTLGTEITTAHSILALLFIFDMIFSIIVCFLFVYKLNKVIKLTSDHGEDKKKKMIRSNSTARKQDQKNDRLLKLMKKQTALVILAILSTFMVLGFGAVYNPISLLMPVDATINTFCVWLMFSFANTIWNKLIGFCCGCCCCCCATNEDNWLQRGSTFSRSISKRISIQSSTSRGPVSSPKNGTNGAEQHTELPPISERVSVKQKDIEIKFDNDITSKDLNMNKQKNDKQKNKNKNKAKNKEEIYSLSDDEQEPQTPQTPVINVNQNGNTLAMQDVESVETSKTELIK